jgi:hypothetical protein
MGMITTAAGDTAVAGTRCLRCCQPAPDFPAVPDGQAFLCLSCLLAVVSGRDAPAAAA